MKVFECQACGQLLDFHNTRCERCGRALGYVADDLALVALEPAGEGVWRAYADPGRRFRYCANDAHDVCNWLVDEGSAHAFCAACRLNRTIPNLAEPRAVVMWRRLEWAKHRLAYGLMRLRLPLTPRFDDPQRGLAFDFLAPEDHISGEVTIGHARGLITLNVTEADDTERERYRANLAEPYRTVLGHLRHEVGHFYWERLIEDSPWLAGFRALFGDEQEDYASALQRNYYAGAPADWSERHITAYAASHPWEDWAETWAHYLHILDTLETAYAWGIVVDPRAGGGHALAVRQDVDPYEEPDLDALLRRWFPLVYAGNALNRSMGQPDLYPFVLRPLVIEKLRFVHQVARGGATEVKT